MVLANFAPEEYDIKLQGDFLKRDQKTGKFIATIWQFHYDVVGQKSFDNCCFFELHEWSHPAKGYLTIRDLFTVAEYDQYMQWQKEKIAALASIRPLRMFAFGIATGKVVLEYGFDLLADEYHNAVVHWCCYTWPFVSVPTDRIAQSEVLVLLACDIRSLLSCHCSHYLHWLYLNQ